MRLEKPLTDVGIVFQDHLLLDFRTGLDNVLLQPQIRGQPAGPCPGGGAAAAARSWALPMRPIVIRVRSPAACGSASRSRGR